MMMLVMAPNQMMVMIVTLVMITNDCDKGIDDGDNVEDQDTCFDDGDHDDDQGPVKGELTLSAEEVDVVLELELENADI